MSLSHPPANFQEMSWELTATFKRLEGLLMAGFEDPAAGMLLQPGNTIPWSDAVQMALNSAVIYQFFDAHPALVAEWQQQLREKKYADFPVVTTLGTRSYSVFSQYIGVWFWSVFQNARNANLPESRQFLEQACEYGVYPACLEKLVMLETGESWHTNTRQAKEIIAWAGQFATTFWSAGYLNAGLVLLNAALHLRKHAQTDAEKTVLEEAVRFFGMGVSLKDHPVSTAIIQTYYPDQGWPAIFADQSAQWISKDADGGMDYMSRILAADFGIPDAGQYLSRIVADARAEAEKIINH